MRPYPVPRASLEGLPGTHKPAWFGTDLRRGSTDRVEVGRGVRSGVADTDMESLLPKQRGDVLELDEAWSFVRQRYNKRWLWTALYGRIRRIVGFAIGQRDEAT
jgi:hypothetical protein